MARQKRKDLVIISSKGLQVTIGLTRLPSTLPSIPQLYPLLPDLLGTRDLLDLFTDVLPSLGTEVPFRPAPVLNSTENPFVGMVVKVKLFNETVVSSSEPRKTDLVILLLQKPQDGTQRGQ